MGHHGLPMSPRHSPMCSRGSQDADSGAPASTSLLHTLRPLARTRSGKDERLDGAAAPAEQSLSESDCPGNQGRRGRSLDLPSMTSLAATRDSDEQLLARAGDETAFKQGLSKEYERLTIKTGHERRHAEVPYAAQSPREAELPELPPKHLYTCTVGRNRSQARFSITGAAEVADLLQQLAATAVHIPRRGGFTRSDSGHHAPTSPRHLLSDDRQPLLTGSPSKLSRARKTVF